MQNKKEIEAGYNTLMTDYTGTSISINTSGPSVPSTSQLSHVDENETPSFECAVCHKVECEEDNGLFDFDMYICSKCSNIFHCDCLNIEPDSELDEQFVSWFNEDGLEEEFDRENMPPKFCPMCREN